MKIVVLVKEVPDTYGDRTLDLETGLAQRAASEPVLDEIGERSLEVALSYADSHPGAEVVVMSMGPQTAASTVRKAMSMGAASAVQVVDDELLGADLGLTAQVLAAALQREEFELVIAGNQSTDGGGGVLGAMLSELLDVPGCLNLVEVSIDENSVRGLRATDSGSVEVSAQLPAVISITEALPDARFPNFKGIMAAKKKPFETLTLSDLNVDSTESSTAHSIMIGVTKSPPRAAGVKIVDAGDAGAQLADYLVENRLV
jgi:electron transfer flavoprotein beta subunit